eukprot:1187595-Prorocentrum_minimum.AAC.6
MYNTSYTTKQPTTNLTRLSNGDTCPEPYRRLACAGNVTGVALRTTEDNKRVAVATADNEHEWQRDTWTAAELAPHVGKEVTLDLHDTRHGAWGWFSADDFTVGQEGARSGSGGGQEGVKKG